LIPNLAALPEILKWVVKMTQKKAAKAPVDRVSAASLPGPKS
jgi:hypothetical protein